MENPQFLPIEALALLPFPGAQYPIPGIDLEALRPTNERELEVTGAETLEITLVSSPDTEEGIYAEQLTIDSPVNVQFR